MKKTFSTFARYFTECPHRLPRKMQVKVFLIHQGRHDYRLET